MSAHHPPASVKAKEKLSAEALCPERVKAEQVSAIGKRSATETGELLPEWNRAKEEPLLAASLSELEALNAAAPSGDLLRVGLRLVPEAFDDGCLPGFRVGTLSALAPRLRGLKRITVRGCWVYGNLTGLHGAALGKFFRACYESAKRMSAVLPCAMPYICAAGALPALERNVAEHPETLEAALNAANIVAMQNATAFYAKLYMT